MATYPSGPERGRYIADLVARMPSTTDSMKRSLETAMDLYVLNAQQIYRQQHKPYRSSAASKRTARIVVKALGKSQKEDLVPFMEELVAQMFKQKVKCKQLERYEVIAAEVDSAIERIPGRAYQQPEPKEPASESKPVPVDPKAKGPRPEPMFPDPEIPDVVADPKDLKAAEDAQAASDLKNCRELLTRIQDLWVGGMSNMPYLDELIQNIDTEQD